MSSTASECVVKDKIDRKKKLKKLQTDGSHEDEIELDTDTSDTKKTKKERLKSKRKRSSALSLADDQIEQTSQNQNFHSEESNQQSPLLVDELPVVPVITVKKKKKKKKPTLAESKSSSICQDVDDCDSVLESPVVLEDDEKKTKRKKKRKERDINEERNNIGDEGCQDDETRTKTTKSKKKKKTTKNEEEHLESVGSNHSNPIDEKFEGEGDSTAIVSGDKKELEKKKKKKHKLKHKEPRELSSSDHIASDKHENNVAERDDELDATVHKIKKKKKKRKREEQESDNVCNVEEEQEENDVKSKSSKKKKKRENDHGNSVDNDDPQLPHSQTTPMSKLFKDAVFESTERKSQFSRITGKSAKVEEDDDKKNKIDSSSQAYNNNIEETSSSPFVRGQWQGALFENERRQNKFLRLLGGMKSTKGDNKKNLFSSQNSSLKKGLYGSLGASVPNLNSSSSDTTVADTKGGKALCISDAAEINKRLEEDYNKAMNFKLSGTKGAGLGFAQDPAEGKKFHIDANSTKSLKFDNDDD